MKLQSAYIIEAIYTGVGGSASVGYIQPAQKRRNDGERLRVGPKTTAQQWVSHRGAARAATLRDALSQYTRHRVCPIA